MQLCTGKDSLELEYHLEIHLSNQIKIMEVTDNSDKEEVPHIGPVEGSDNEDVSTRQLDDGDEVRSMATPTLDERDGMSLSGKN